MAFQLQTVHIVTKYRGHQSNISGTLKNDSYSWLKLMISLHFPLTTDPQVLKVFLSQ